MIPVILIWRENTLQEETEEYVAHRRHAILPAIPPMGTLLIPPGEMVARNVRAQEWDCSRGNGSAATIMILLDD